MRPSELQVVQVLRIARERRPTEPPPAVRTLHYAVLAARKRALVGTGGYRA